MIKRYSHLAILLTMVGFWGLISLFAKEPPNKRKFVLSKITGKTFSTLSNVNNFSVWVQADGTSARNPFYQSSSFNDNRSGGVFPRGTAGVIFADAILWGGMVNDGQLPRLRVGGSTYRSGMVEGAILGEQTGIAEDPAASDVRIWRVRKDWVTADLLQDAAEFFNLDASSVSDAQIAEVRAQYGTDWDEWPAAKGAPFYDNNNDGLYDPFYRQTGISSC